MQFGATLVYTSAKDLEKTKVIGIASLTILRYFSEPLSILIKLFIGYFSDFINKRKIFLLFGYGSAVLFKIMFYGCLREDLFGLSICSLMYIFAHVTDRLMNSVRDISRDSLILVSIKPEHKLISYGLRKGIAASGTILGGLLTILLDYKNILPRFKFGFAILPVAFATLLLYFQVKETRIEPTNNNLEKPEKIKISELFQKKNIKSFLVIGLTYFIFLGRMNDMVFFNLGNLAKIPYAYPLLMTVLYGSITVFSFLFSYLLQKSKIKISAILMLISLILSNFLLSYVEIGGINSAMSNFLVFTTKFTSLGLGITFTISKIAAIILSIILLGIFSGGAETILSSMLASTIQDKKYAGSFFGISCLATGLASITNASIYTYFYTKLITQFPTLPISKILSLAIHKISFLSGFSSILSIILINIIFLL